MSMCMCHMCECFIGMHVLLQLFHMFLVYNLSMCIIYVCMFIAGHYVYMYTIHTYIHIAAHIFVNKLIHSLKSKFSRNWFSILAQTLNSDDKTCTGMQYFLKHISRYREDFAWWLWCDRPWVKAGMASKIRSGRPLTSATRWVMPWGVRWSLQIRWYCVYMYVCLYLCLYVCVCHVCICVFLYLCVCVRMHVCIYVYIYA